MKVSWQLADSLQSGGSQPKIDPNMWTAWWGTNAPKFPDNDTWNNGANVMLPLTQNLTISTGDIVTTTYAVSMPGNHAAATVTYPYGLAETDVTCLDGTSYTLTVPLAAQTFTIPANDNTVHQSTPGSAPNPGCANGAPGQTKGGYFFALGKQSPGAGNPGGPGFTTTDGTQATAQTDPLSVTFSMSDSTNGQGGTWAPTTAINFQNPYSCTPPGCPLTPIISWPVPSGMVYGTPLSSAQLNATASALLISGLQTPGTNSGLMTPVTVPGTFTYSPALGTVLPPGPQTLSVTFTPDAVGTKYTNYTIATATLPITVGTVTITATGALSKIAGGYQMIVTVKNAGNVVASNVQLTQATLGAASGATIPASLGDIPSGGSASVTLTFPASAGADGAGVVEKLAGTYTGGTLGGTYRVVLP
jgi:hypothetical protein